MLLPWQESRAFRRVSTAKVAADWKANAVQWSPYFDFDALNFLQPELMLLTPFFKPFQQYFYLHSGFQVKAMIFLHCPAIVSILEVCLFGPSLVFQMLFGWTAEASSGSSSMWCYSNVLWPRAVALMQDYALWVNELAFSEKHWHQTDVVRGNKAVGIAVSDGTWHGEVDLLHWSHSYPLCLAYWKWARCPEQNIGQIMPPSVRVCTCACICVCALYSSDRKGVVIYCWTFCFIGLTLSAGLLKHPTVTVSRRVVFTALRNPSISHNSAMSCHVNFK